MRGRKTLTTVNLEEGMDQNGLLSAQQLYIFLKNRNDKLFLINLVLDTLIPMNNMDKLVFGISLYSIQIQFAKWIRVEVHGIILSLPSTYKNKSKSQYYFV